MLSDLSKLAKMIDRDEYLKRIIRCEQLVEIENCNFKYPIHSFSIGSNKPESPVLFITGGVHGLERIGAQLAWSFLKTTLDRLLWDKSTRAIFENIRLSVIPLVNPVGYENYTRSNGNGVDLMRNSPIRCKEAPFLVGGQRISHKLPWYQGIDGVLEPENEALLQFFKQETVNSSCVISVDFHSGFGMKDRIWFPFSNTREPFENLPELHALIQLFEQVHPYHIYQIEPQSKGYLLNGDMWDFIYLNFKSENKNSIFLPLTLEMGSWIWVKKNPAQLFSKHGIFNPIKEHRLKRTYRRHHLLFDFLLRALLSNETWSKLDVSSRIKNETKGKQRWY